MSIITYPLNNITYQAADAELYNSTRTSGVWGLGDNLGVSAINGMSVTIAPGLAWIKNTDFAGKCVGVTAPVTLTLSPADNTNPRIDRIVLRFTTAGNATEMVVKKGTPAASPVPVARVATAQIYELVLYDILVPAASASIATGSITDQRANPGLCGIMRDAVEGAVPDSRKINGKELKSDITLTASDVGVSPSDYVARSGGTMTGALTLNGDPTAAMHAATKQYVDNKKLVELVRFTSSGTFNPASYPSAGNEYVVLIQGAGGAGDSAGGGAGALLIIPFVHIGIKTAYTVAVGAAGTYPYSKTGGSSSFDKWTAPGGGGADGFTPGTGGVVAGYAAEAGSYSDVRPYRAGGSSQFGTGGYSYTGPTGTAGGTGAGGGYRSNGGDGLVIVFGFSY